MKNKRNWRNETVLRELYIKQGYSAADIAQTYGLTEALVCDRLSSLGLMSAKHASPASNGLARKIELERNSEVE